MTEIWKYIKGFERFYQVSNLGRVRSMKIWLRRGKYMKVGKEPYTIMKPGLWGEGYQNGFGYLYLRLRKENKYVSIPVHRLVADAFIKNDEMKPFVNHIDFNRVNNCVTNLEWVTAKENSKHSHDYILSKMPRGVDNYKTKLSEKDVLEIRRKYDGKRKTILRMAEKYGMRESGIWGVANRRTWKHI